MECRFLLTSRERRFLLAGDFLATAFLVVTITRVPRSRLPAPLRGSTPRRFSIVSLTVTKQCRSAQDDTEADCCVRGTILVC